MGEEKLTLTIFEVLEKIERKKGEKKRKIFFSKLDFNKYFVWQRKVTPCT